MYEAMRQRAYNSSQIAGVSTTICVLAATSYLVLSGLGEQIVRVVVPPTIFVEVPTREPEQKEPIEQTKFDTTVVLDEPPPPTMPLEEFKRDEPPPITVTKRADETDVGVGTIAPPPAPVRTWPVMRTTEKPVYPAPDIRDGNEGITGLLVCVGANGRVSSATLDYSSGHARLDEAALKWIRGVRFSPGTLDGASQAMCGHKVRYEWTIEGNGRR